MAHQPQYSNVSKQLQHYIAVKAWGLTVKPKFTTKNQRNHKSNSRRTQGGNYLIIDPWPLNPPAVIEVLRLFFTGRITHHLVRREVDVTWQNQEVTEEEEEEERQIKIKFRATVTRVQESLTFVWPIKARRSAWSHLSYTSSQKDSFLWQTEEFTRLNSPISVKASCNGFCGNCFSVHLSLHLRTSGIENEESNTCNLNTSKQEITCDLSF